MKTQLLKRIHDSRQYTLSVAEALPEKNYDSVLVNGSWSFVELMNHIAYGLYWWENNYVKGDKIDWEPPADKKTKKEVIDRLTRGFESLEKTVSGANENDKLTNGVWATLDHVAHHRGQAVVHLRKNGVEPPEYNTN